MRMLLLSATVALGLALPMLVDAQPFTHITDPTNPVVTDLPPPGGFGGAAWADADGDGLPDLLVANRSLFRNLGGGAFARWPVPNLQGGLGVSMADADNDGDADLMVAGDSNAGHGSHYWRNDGGTFVQVTTGAIGDSLGNVGWACAWGDYDADGFVDLVIACAHGFGMLGPNKLFHNQGDGTFAKILTTDVTTSIGPHTIPSWSDFDQDGDLDLAIGTGPANGGTGPDYFYRNQRIEGGAPILQRITTGALATDNRDGQIINFIDYDNDGDLDCFITNFFVTANHLYRNEGGVYVRKFAAQVGPIASDIGYNLGQVWNDFDNDGDLDCYVGRGGGFAGKYYRNEGNGTFASVAIGELTTAGTVIPVAADYDRDGDVDLFVATAPPGRGLYRNDLAAGRHWVEFSLRGMVSNRSALGARIHVLATINGQPVWQIREVSAQNSFNGHSEWTQHVGLGDATRIDSLRVHWPNGLVERYGNLAADQVIPVVEGDSFPTPTAAALVEARVTGEGVALAWYGEGLQPVGATVYRRPVDGAWSALGRPFLDGRDRIAYLDAAPAGRWAYRLGLPDAEGEWFTAETWVTVPEIALAIRMPVTNAGAGRLRIEFTLPRGGGTRLQVIDATGRRISAVDLGALGAGIHTHELSVRELPAGVYWVRLEHDGATVTGRTAVVR